MGSFNTACFVTRQTITPGDEVVIIPIVQSTNNRPITIVNTKTQEEMQVFSSFQSTCYPTGFWQYYGLFIKGTYYDYGRFEISKDPDNVRRLKNLLISLSDDMFLSKRGENKYHDLGMDPPSVDESSSDEKVLEEWDTLYDGIFEGRVFTKTYFGNPAQFSVAVMLKITYDELINMARKETLYNGIKCTVDELCVEAINEQLSTLRTYYNCLIDANAENVGFAMLPIITSAPSRALAGLGAIGLKDFYTAHLYEQSNVLESEIADLVSSPGKCTVVPPNIKHLISWQVENLIVNLSLSLMEIRIEPTYYTGQDYDNTNGKKFKKLVSTVCAAHNKALNARYE